MTVDKLKPYFAYDGTDITIRIKRNHPAQWSLNALIKKIQDKGVTGPYVIHLEPILLEQYTYIHEQFKHALSQYNYAGSYLFAYPVKVNAKQHVFQSLSTQKAHRSSFEVGSKPELLAALQYASQDTIIICNGIKDRDYLTLANKSALKGPAVFIVIQNDFEIDTVRNFLTNTQHAAFKIGVRIKGWANPQSKFYDKFGLGLSSIQALSTMLINTMSAHLLELIHFHNAWKNPEQLKTQIRYAFKVYSELLKHHPIQYINCGGGIPSDDNATEYYDIPTYAQYMVAEFKTCAQTFDVPEPTIITESGSALMHATEIVITQKIGETKVCSQQLIAQEKLWLESTHPLGDFQHETANTDKSNVWLNFSVFSSIPDAWGLKKNFPIVSLGPPGSHYEYQHLFDITCDPDGHITPNSKVQPAQNSVTFAILYAGAYQYMLASSHNMLTRPAQIVVREENNKPVIEVVEDEFNQDASSHQYDSPPYKRIAYLDSSPSYSERFDHHDA